MIYGYARVSTAGQAKDGNSLEAQEKLLKENGAMEIYHDAFTGTKIDRPEFTKLIGKLESGDTLVVTKLDRLGRSLSQTTDLITELLDKNIAINILNVGVLNNSSMSTFLRNILLSFAQFERDMIVERTSEGKAIAKLDPNFKEGRPAFTGVIDRQEGETVKDVCARLGISKTTYYKYAQN